MPWFYLLVSGIFEIGWAIGLKSTQGFTRMWPMVYTFVTGACSLIFLGLAMRDLPVGSAYPAWVGIGVVGAVAIGIVYFQETATLTKLMFILLILVGIAGLKMTSN